MQSSNLTRSEREAKNLRKAWRRKIVFVFFLFIGFVIVLESPLTRVRKLQVSGNTTIPEQALIKASHLYTGMSLWQVNGRAVNVAIRAKDPFVQSVDVKTNYYTGTVSLQVQEKHVVAIFESAGKFYDLLNDGTIYSTVKPTSGFSRPIITADKPSVVATGQAADNPFVATVAKQLSALPVSDTESISEIHIDNYGIANIYLNDGFAAQCLSGSLAKMMPNVNAAIHYFLSKGYAPGIIDLTGTPPYRYTPFVSNTKKGKKS